MSSNIDFSQYKRKTTPSESKTVDFSQYKRKLIEPEIEQEENANSGLRKTGRISAQYGIGNVERLAAPYDIAVSPLSSEKAQMVPYRESLFSDIERLQEQKQYGQWDEEDQKLYDSLIEQVKDPEKAKKNVKTLDISSGNLIEKGAKKLGLDLEPEDVTEIGARIGGNLLSPKGVVKGVEKGAKYGKSLLSKESREAFKQESQLKSLRKGIKGNVEKENIVNFSEKHKLTPEETTLLLQSDANIEKIGKIAKKTNKFKKTAESLKTKLGDSYEELKTLGREGGYLSASEENALRNDLGTVLKDIGKTFVEGPDTKGARLAIEEAIVNISEKGGTVEDLINSVQNLRQVANWKKVDPKGAILKKAEKAIHTAIERKNPKIAENLKFTDQSYAKYKKFEKVLEKKQAAAKWHGIEIPDFMSDIAFLSVLKLTGLSHPTALSTVAAKEAVQRISTRFLTDPKYQGIHKKIIHSIQTGSTEKQKKLFSVLRTMLKKDDPETYDEISDITFD